MPETPAREAAYAAIAERLRVRLPDVTIERNRPGTTGPDSDLPLISVDDGDLQVAGADADGGAGGFGLSLYRCTVTLVGYAKAEDEQMLETAISELHARAVRALICDGGTTPVPLQINPGVAETEARHIHPAEAACDISRASVAESETPFADFTAVFRFDLPIAIGNPFVTTA